ncbi:hypothetical protein M3599_04465 [Niallia circulans]|uniref:hypothetical protein n=1 Tax=Niallia circulans TaxID=1397 RepID=UPI002041FB10|nr:hypothetical protein [Niallia circulans]MCM2980180.1 hypothetical protein [Niallia circulans]
MVQDYWAKGGGFWTKPENISQSRKISAKVGRESAKIEKYQPKWGGNQPKQKNISQSG